MGYMHRIGALQQLIDNDFDLSRRIECSGGLATTAASPRVQAGKTASRL
jgi:hypothetical protein